METTTQEVIYQIIVVVLGGLSSVVLIGIKQYIKDKEIQNLLTRAVMYAEQKGKVYAKENAKFLSGKIKLKYAKDFINQIDPKTAKALGDQIEPLIEAKVAETFKTSLKDR